MLEYSIIDTKSQYINIEASQDYHLESLDAYEIITTAKQLGFQFTNVGYFIADDGSWLPDPMRGTPSPLTQAQLDILYALSFREAYSQDGSLDVDFICHLFADLYSVGDVQDAVHWLAINGAIHRQDNGRYSLDEIVRQSELFLQRIEDLPNTEQWIETAILRPVVMSEMGAIA